MLITRTPRPALRPWIKLLWASDPVPARGSAPPALEHVLPTGDMHLALRLDGSPLKVLGPAGCSPGLAVVGGARSSYYARETGTAGRGVGAQLHPGAAWPLFAASACALAEAHTPLDLLWGLDASRTLDQLDAAGDARQRLDLLEKLLARRLAHAEGLHPAVAQGIQRLSAGGSVAQAVLGSGYSHRHFMALFREHTGLAPKLYSRVQRFQGVLRRLGTDRQLPAAELAHEAGYSDQAHFQRDFRAFAGLTPQAWRLAAPRHPNHVRVG